MDMIVPFRSRGDAIKVYNLLIAERFSATLISTPPRYGKSCGLSLVTSSSNKSLIEEFIRAYRINSCMGFYKKY